MGRGEYFDGGTSGDNRVLCTLCPRFCRIKEGQTGFCGVRGNREGRGVSLAYGRLSAVNIDPVEKKPLYHFMPGSSLLSVGSYGCNLTCLHCQNHTIAQGDFSSPMESRPLVNPEDLLARLDDTAGVAYTYNEPIVWYEYMIDCAALVHEKGKANVMVSNGYINPDPLEKLIPLTDAFSIDLKGFSEQFYGDVSQGRLEPVLESLKIIARSGTHLEVEYLVIPGLNDDEGEFDAMLEWYVRYLGPSVPLHINRYYPQHRMARPATPLELLEKLYARAERALEYVFVGNAAVDFGQHTQCPSCGFLLIRRDGYRIKSFMKEAVCPECGREIPLVTGGRL